MAAQVKEILKREKYHIGQNGNVRSYMQDVADYVSPRKAWMNTMRTKGESMRFNYLYSSMPINAVQKCVSGFHSNLTNESTKWYGLSLYDQNKMSKALEIWFKQVVEIMMSIQRQTNLYNVLKEFYHDYIVFPLGDILTLPHPKRKVSYMSIPANQLSVEEDDEGRVNAVYNSFTLTALQAYQKWGDKAGRTVKELATTDTKCYDKLEFLHYCGPRGKRNPNYIDALNMPWESCWIAKKDEHLIEESGFDHFPHQVGRFWKDNSDSFGFSPAMMALADIKLINACVKTWLRRAMKEADPPLSVPSRGHILPLNLNPGAMNIRKPELIQETLHAIGVASGDFSITEKFLQYIENNINQAFFLDVFQSFSLLTKDMTVPEVQKRISEGMVLLGPVVNQCQYEVLTPLVLNTFFILLDAGMFPPVPQELFDNEFGPVYDSPLSRAAKESEATNMDGFLVRATNLAGVYPDVLHRIDPHKTLSFYAKTMNVSPEILRTDQEVQKIIEQMQKMQQAQSMLQTAHAGAVIAKEGSAAEKNMADATAK